jgi:hypothetical protein
MQVIQLSPGCCWQCIRKLEPLHSAPGTALQSTAPGAETARGSGLALPYSAQYVVNTLSAKRHEPQVPFPGRLAGVKMGSGCPPTPTLPWDQ